MPSTLLLASEFPASWEKIRRALNGKTRGPKVVFIPTAAYGDGFEPDEALYIRPWTENGFRVELFDLKDKPESETAAMLADAAIVCVCGGNSFYLLEHMNQSGFRRVLAERLPQGLIYIGSSAGSIVCAPDIAHIAPMDDPSKATLERTQGLGLIDFLFVPHLDHETLGPAAQTIVSGYHGATPMLALYDAQLLSVEDRVVKVL